MSNGKPMQYATWPRSVAICQMTYRKKNNCAVVRKVDYSDRMAGTVVPWEAYNHAHLIH